MNPLPPKSSYAVVTAVPHIRTGASTPTSMGMQVAPTVPILGVLQVSNPTGTQGIKVVARVFALFGAHTPLAVSSIVPPMTQHSCSPPGRVEVPEVKL